MIPTTLPADRTIQWGDLCVAMNPVVPPDCIVFLQQFTGGKGDVIHDMKICKLADLDPSVRPREADTLVIRMRSPIRWPGMRKPRIEKKVRARMKERG